MPDHPAEIIYRRMAPADVERCMALKALQGWNQLREDWDLFLGFFPEGCFVACQGERLVGTLTSIDYAGRFSWIGMLLVHPEMRRCGIGRNLMARALEALARCETVKLDATPAGRSLYTQLGFADEYELGRMTTAAALWSPVPAGAAAVAAIGPADLDEVAALDLPVFGADRRPVLAAWYRRAPQSAFLVRRGGRIAGYAMGRPGSNFDMIGPVVAACEADACALAGAVGRSFGQRPLGLDLVQRHGGFRSWLEASHFAFQRPLTRMYRGPNRCPGLPERQWCVLGPEVG